MTFWTWLITFSPCHCVCISTVFSYPLNIWQALWFFLVHGYVNSVPIDRCVGLFPRWSCFFEQNICLLVELASHIHGSIFLFSNYMLFPIITILTYIPIKKCMCSFSLHPCKLFSLFDSSCSTCCEVIPLCGFDLYYLVTVFQLDHMCIPVGQHR